MLLPPITPSDANCPASAELVAREALSSKRNDGVVHRNDDNEGRLTRIMAREGLVNVLASICKTLEASDLEFTAGNGLGTGVRARKAEN